MVLFHRKYLSVKAGKSVLRTSNFTTKEGEPGAVGKRKADFVRKSRQKILY